MLAQTDSDPAREQEACFLYRQTTITAMMRLLAPAPLLYQNQRWRSQKCHACGPTDDIGSAQNGLLLQERLHCGERFEVNLGTRFVANFLADKLLMAFGQQHDRTGFA